MIEKTKKKDRLKNDFINKHYISYLYHRLKNDYSYKELSFVVNMYQDLLFKDISNGLDVEFLNGLGIISMDKIKYEIGIDSNGNIGNNLPINYPKTFELWKTNPELKHKQYVRCLNEHSNGFLFRLKLRRVKNGFPLNNIYSFKKSRMLKKAMSDNIRDNKIDAVLARKY